jgi:hypothetical protein
MKVLNAVPLKATASRKAIAFSLIMRMVLVPCSVVVRVGPDGDGERNHRPGARIICESARNFQTLS